MIPPALAALFPADVRARGEAYFGGRRLRIVAADDRAIAAFVRGTRDYVVNVTARRGKVLVECSCPYAFDWGICKHAWAVLRHADIDGTLAALIAGAGAKPIFRAEPGLEPLDAADPDSNPRLDDFQHTHAGTRWESRPQPPPWKRILDSAQQQMRYFDPGQSHAAVTWPNERRLIYIVDLDATAYGDGVVVHLGTEKRRKDGTWDAPKN
ncbi:MAG: SWIM zinc finger family protein, partial [Gemmatimonadaceae bacterium]